MKKSVRIWTVRGILVTITVLIIEILSIYFQTDPGVTYTGIINVLIVLGITGAVLFAIAVSEWKRDINDILILILIVIGLVGVSTSISFHNALVDAFFPRTSISVFLSINFMMIGMVGVFLLIFRGRMPFK